MKNSRLVYLVLAAATGLAVSGIYLNQTLLGRLAETFHAAPSAIGLLATLTQVGYAFGIFFLVPMGDIANKKKLAIAKMSLLSLALLALGASARIWQLYVASALVGVCASVAQDFVPIAAELALPTQRGRIVGIVMSGLLIGILASRTVSGWIETTFNWHWVFWSFSAAIALFIAIVGAMVPTVPAGQTITYRALMSKLIRMPKQEPRLRLALITHGLVGLAFSSFWTNLSFHLSEPRFGFTTLQIGLFGLAGAAGAGAAPLAGKFADSRGPIYVIRIGILLVAVSFGWMLLLPDSIPGLIAGALVFDAGTQLSLISHQTIIYSLNASARSSLNAVFVTGMFVSFAIGSALSTAIYGKSGWVGVMALALAASVAAFTMAQRSGRTAV